MYLLGTSNKENKIKKTQRLILTILLAFAPLFFAQQVLAETREEYNAIVAEAQAKVDAAQYALEQAEKELGAAQELQTQTNEAVIGAQEILNNKNAVVEDKAEAVAVARAAVEQAQYNYDNNLISDPDWTAPTYQKEHIRTVTNTRTIQVRTLVPHTETTLQEQVIPNLLPNPTLTSTDGWSGVYAGWQGSHPGMFDGEIVFSYMNQTVSQGLYSGPFQNATLTLSADWYSDWTSDSYSMTVAAEDINRNPVGTATYTNTRTGHDWTNRSVTFKATGPVSYITVSFSGIDHGYWYGMYGPRMKNPALEVSYGQLVTETTYEEVITYEEEIYYTYETYYTTELLLTEGTVNVNINEGGEATFVAPGDAVFTSSNLRYEAIDNPDCGKAISPSNLGGNTIELVANNAIWGDPCGGWYKHIVGTLSYLEQPTAPLIKNPELLLLIKEPQDIYSNAVIEYGVAQSDLENASIELRVLQEKQNENTVIIEVASADVITKQEELVVAQQELNAIPPYEEPTPTPTETEEPVEEPEENEPEPLPEPEPPVSPEPSEPELPVNIETVDPQSLSTEQVAELISVANTILENSEQGSPEYEEALDALFVAAQADDIVISEELAAIPGAEALVGAINFMGNVGSDMSPKVREESEKIVVTAVVAVGAAVNAATGAALTAAAPSAAASASAGGSSGTSSIRRKD